MGETGLRCYHCHQPVGHAPFTASLKGQPQVFCCAGCRAVAELVHRDGLESFYQFRDADLAPPTPLSDKDLAFYRIHDRDDVLERVSVPEERLPGHRRIRLGIEGISCAACVWLLEQVISRLSGVAEFGVNLGNHRAELVWSQSVRPLSEIFGELHRLGFRPFPYDETEEERRIAREQRTTLFRIGVAGIGMMQSMMLAIPVYFGMLEASGPDFLQLFWTVSMIIATPVVFFSARPFFTAARRDLRARHLTMDVPVSIAIGGAYAASCYITLFGGEEVYFDSVSMFTFFLLISRFLESRARIAAARSRQRLLRSTPSLVRKVTEAGEQLVLLEEVRCGDRIRFVTGDMIPVDGVIAEGQGEFNEAAMTGEFRPLSRQAGDTLVSGSLLTEGSVILEVAQRPEDSQLSVLQRLVDRALAEKPAMITSTDRMASVFVARVLVSAVVVAGIWLIIDPSRAFPITLAVLVATCPCAVSLAAPTALTAATNALRDVGFIITRMHVLQTLAGATRAIFDKTGTLTLGAFELVSLENRSDLAPEALLALAGDLERHSLHPIARFFQSYGSGTMDDIRSVTGAGIEGRREGQLFRIGTAAFAGWPLPPTPADTRDTDTEERPAANAVHVFLTRDGLPLACFVLQDRLRPGATTLISTLREQLKVNSEILTGDGRANALALARQLDLHEVYYSRTPDQKLEHVRAAAERETVVMIGDGLNDVPAMAAAHLSIAMAEASDLAAVKADAIMLNPRLETLSAAFEHARKTERIIRQNLRWALGYNLTVLPLAALGFITPYLAALGMSMSSLVVVFNALRLSRVHRTEQPITEAG